MSKHTRRSGRVNGVAKLESIVRQRFPDARPTRRVGIEIEAIPVRAGTGAPVLPEDDDTGHGSLSVLRRLAAQLDWPEEDTGFGVPRFALPDGSVISYEPGGQLEWSSAVYDDLTSLDEAMRNIAGRLASAMDDAGIDLLARGIDATTPIDAAKQVMTGERYRRQRLHYDRIGAAGRIMMLQTAGIHLNIDPGADSVDAWNAANVLAPLLVAIFANSAQRSAELEPHRSHRAANWRRVDPSRTAVFVPSTDPAPEYLAFALGARSFLLGEDEVESQPFSDWHGDGAAEDDFARHLTTLFPEVRPRGSYFELRSVDALPARLAVVPLAVAWAAMHHARLRRELLGELPAPTVERLERAARYGLGDPSLRDEARWLAARVPAALADLLPGGSGRDMARRVEEFFATYTERDRDPGSAPESRLDS